MKELKVFRDPLYGYVKVEDDLIWDLIQTKELQRLRRIHQLGGTFVVYHTAEHSRFSHSLGVYEVARRIIYEVPDIRETLTKEEKLITLCAALLHDIGHGPFSHSFELVFYTIHEEYSIAIITDPETEVNQTLEAYEPGFSHKVASVIQKKCYKETCDGACSHVIMNSIISSQLDADRLDYLQRDAYNSGATYGEIDLDRIIRSFLVAQGRIAFKYSSMHAIEDYLMSRYHMYWQVYFHPVAISFEIILINLFKRIKILLENNFRFRSDVSVMKKINNQDIDIKTYLDLDEAWVISKIKEWEHESDAILSDLCNRFLNRRLLKYVDCRNPEILEAKYEKMAGLFKKYKIDTDYYLYKDTLVKEAYQYYHKDTVPKEPIFLYIDGKLKEIAEVSQVVKGITDVGPKTDYKLYYPLEAEEAFNDSDRELFMELTHDDY